MRRRRNLVEREAERLTERFARRELHVLQWELLWLERRYGMGSVWKREVGKRGDTVDMIGRAHQQAYQEPLF